MRYILLTGVLLFAACVTETAEPEEDAGVLEQCEQLGWRMASCPFPDKEYSDGGKTPPNVALDMPYWRDRCIDDDPAVRDCLLQCVLAKDCYHLCLCVAPCTGVDVDVCPTEEEQAAGLPRPQQPS